MIRRRTPRRSRTSALTMCACALMAAACADGGSDSREAAPAPASAPAEDPNADDEPWSELGQSTSRNNLPNWPATGAGGGSSGADVSAPTGWEVCWGAPPAAGSDGISFSDATSELGLVDPLVGMYGHAIAVGDPNADGWPDLFVGTFADRPIEDYQVRGSDGPSPDRVLLGGPDGFSVDESFPGQMARSSGATFADLDGDGDEDLVVTRNPRGDDEIGGRPTTIFERAGNGWSVATELAADVGGRSVAAADFDGDGLLDLAIAGDRFGAGPTRFYRNTGGLGFEDATAEWGIPDDVETLALATVDLDGDGALDVVFSGDTRVLLGRGSGSFDVVDEPLLAWELFGNEDDPAGMAIGDLDNDGRPDLVIGQHFNSTLDFGELVPVRVLLNRSEPGQLSFTDATEASGSPALPTKSPHVAIADLDNDGWPDVVTSARDGNGMPVVLRNDGVVDGIPQLEAASEPTSADYFVTGATVDLDRDGRLDMVQVAWEPATPSLAVLNASRSGDWIELDLSSADLPTGTRIDVEHADGEVSTTWTQSTSGYAAGEPATVHLGLGQVEGGAIVRIEDSEVAQFEAGNVKASAGTCAQP